MRTYVLGTAEEVENSAVQTRRPIVPPRVKPGERRPRAFTTDDLNGLFATSHTLAPEALLTLNPPPQRRITTWPALRDMLARLKVTVTNYRRRHGFPAALVTVEFDPVTEGEVPVYCANFHVGLAAPLTPEQEKRICVWWLKVNGLSDNRGRAFQQDANGGGRQLADYLAKDRTHRGGKVRYVKIPAPWLPDRLDRRLWFTVGLERVSAAKGAAMRRARGLIRKKADSAQGSAPVRALTAGKDTNDCAQGKPLITADGLANQAGPAKAVSIDGLPPISFQIRASAPHCESCMRLCRKRLWDGPCVWRGNARIGFVSLQSGSGLLSSEAV